MSKKRHVYDTYDLEDKDFDRVHSELMERDLKDIFLRLSYILIEIEEKLDLIIDHMDIQENSNED